MPKQFLTVNEVAKLFSVTPLTIRNWDKKGALVAHRNPVNNYRVYKIEDVESLMKGIENNKTSMRPFTKKLSASSADRPADQPRKLKIEVL